MRRLLAAFLIVALLTPILASAKTVVYVSKSNCAGLTCECLAADDKSFCNRLKGLGYDVVIDTEGDAKDNSTIWRTDSAKADMIFLGDVSTAVMDKTQSQPKFCGNITAVNKKVFAAFGSAYKNRSLEGCAFPLALVSYPDNDNICNSNNLRITESNYITRGIELNNITTVYSDSQDIKINYGISTASVHCDPSADSVPTGLYSAIATSSRGTFWGLDKPAKLTSTGWALFDRAVLFTTGDNAWNVTFFTIPEKVSSNKSFMLFAKVKSLSAYIISGSTNATLNGQFLGTLAYSNATGYWESRGLNIKNGGELAVAAADGSAAKQYDSGAYDVRIISGAYQPGKTYAAKANVFISNFQTTAPMTYRVWTAKNLTLLASGAMSLIDGTYYADAVLNNSEELILEVNAFNDPVSGGAFKLIRPQNATVDYSVAPNDWVVTATKTGSESMTFTITTGSALTGITVDRGGDLSDDIYLNTSVMKTELQSGYSTTFSARLDWHSLAEGTYRGEIILNSDQFSATLPVTLNYFKVTGDWLEAEPKILKVSVPRDRAVTETIRLSNTATLPNTGLKVSASGDLAGMVSFAKEPYYVNASRTRDVEITIDPSGKAEGTYDGTITFTGSLGKADIVATVEITPSLSALLLNLSTEWYAQLDRLTSGGAQLSPEAKQLSDVINITLTGAKESASSGDYSAAMSAYNNAKEQVAQLANIQKDSGLGWLTAVLIVIALGIFGYAGWNYYKKKKAPKKKAALPDAGDQYRTEYY